MLLSKGKDVTNFVIEFRLFGRNELFSGGINLIMFRAPITCSVKKLRLVDISNPSRCVFLIFAP